MVIIIKQNVWVTENWDPYANIQMLWFYDDYIMCDKRQYWVCLLSKLCVQFLLICYLEEKVHKQKRAHIILLITMPIADTIFYVTVLDAYFQLVGQNLEGDYLDQVENNTWKIWEYTFYERTPTK